ncbi:MAG: hypothetical protein ACLUNV_10280 [Sutterella wadsworthensis]
MAAYLMLLLGHRVEVAIRRPTVRRSCFSSSSLQPEQRPGLLKLAAQLGYQSGRFEAVPGHVDAWIEVKGMPRTVAKRRRDGGDDDAGGLCAARARTRPSGARPREGGLRHRTCPGARRLRARALRLARRREGRAGLPARDGARLERTPYWSRWGSLVQQAGDGRQALDILSSARKAGRLDGVSCRFFFRS